jgi:hypothetical protein
MRAERIERIERAERSERAAQADRLAVCLLACLRSHCPPAEAGTCSDVGAVQLGVRRQGGRRRLDRQDLEYSAPAPRHRPTTTSPPSFPSVHFPYGNANHTSVGLTNGRLQFKTPGDSGAWATTPRTYPLGYPNKSVERVRIYGAASSLGGRQGDLGAGQYELTATRGDLGASSGVRLQGSAFTMQMVLYENGTSSTSTDRW